MYDSSNASILHNNHYISIKYWHTHTHIDTHTYIIYKFIYIYTHTYILYTYTVNRVTYTDEYRACFWTSSDTSGMNLYTSPY